MLALAVMRRLGCLAGLLLLGCTKQLPPPPAPVASVPPEFQDAPPGDGGLARVILDTDVPATVERDAGSVEVYERRFNRRVYPVRSWGSNHAVLGTQWELLCAATPCSFTLPYGEHRLRFRAKGDEGRHSETKIRVTRPTEVVQHTLGAERTSAGTLVGATMLAMSALALFAPYGFNMKIGKPTSHLVFASSVAGAFGGVAVMSFFPNTRQDGATTQTSTAPVEARRAAGLSLGFAF